MSSRGGVPDLERVEAIINNDAIYTLAEIIPDTDTTRGGRQRHYPTYMWIVYEALISVYGSARKVDAELSHPVVWDFLRNAMRARFAHRPDQWLPPTPMRRHH
jgi:hypothetical protein